MLDNLDKSGLIAVTYTAFHVCAVKDLQDVLFLADCRAYLRNGRAYGMSCRLLSVVVCNGCIVTKR